MRSIWLWSRCSVLIWGLDLLLSQKMRMKSQRNSLNIKMTVKLTEQSLIYLKRKLRSAVLSLSIRKHHLRLLKKIWPPNKLPSSRSFRKMPNPLLELLRHSVAPAQSCSQEQRKNLRLPKLRSMRPLPQSLLTSQTIKTNRLLEFHVYQQLK